MEHGGGDSTSDLEDRENVAVDYPSDQICGASNGASSEIHESHDGTTTYSAVTNKSLTVEELEMLLGAYFVQIGGTLNKLSTVFIYMQYFYYDLLMKLTCVLMLIINTYLLGMECDVEAEGLRG